LITTQKIGVAADGKTKVASHVTTSSKLQLMFWERSPLEKVRRFGAMVVTVQPWM